MGAKFMTSYKIHLLRTGSTQESTTRRCVGSLDAPLSPGGRSALEALARQARYPQVERVYASPLTRCLQSTGIIYPGQAPQPVQGLADMNLGAFEGRSIEELQKDAAFARWLQDSQGNPPPGGEQVADFTQRIVAAFNATVREMMRQKVTSAAVVTHGGVIMSLMAAVALPKAPLHDWAVANGHGYTLLTSTQLWMQGGCAEAFATLPLHETDEQFP